MPHIYLADAHPDERSALRLLLADLTMGIVGEAADWSAAMIDAPISHLNALVVDLELLPAGYKEAIAQMRKACPTPIVVVLLSNLSVRQQASLSSGADVFISRGDLLETITSTLRRVAVWVRPVSPE